MLAPPTHVLGLYCDLYLYRPIYNTVNMEPGMNVEAIGLLTKSAIYALASSIDAKYGPWDRFVYASCYVKMATIT